MADHVQLHQGWMRNFRNEVKDGEQVYCLNTSKYTYGDDKTILKPLEIGSIKIKRLGASPNYYVRDFEHYLDKSWESKFGELNKYILHEFKKNSNYINLTDEQIEFLQKFMAVNMGRSLFMKKEMIKQAKEPYELIGIREILPASIISENSKLFEDKNIQFLRNNTKIGFVLPSMSYYYVLTKYQATPVIPLSNKLAIRFIKKEDPAVDDMAKCFVIPIDDEENIIRYNYSALLTELNTNQHFVIAKQKEDLECLFKKDIEEKL